MRVALLLNSEMNHGAMGKFCLALCLILTLSAKTFGESTNTLWNETNIDKLKSDLLKDYDRLTRPENSEAATQCWLSLTVIHMDLKEKEGVLETHAWLKMNWTDSKMKWDPLKYSNITTFNIAADEVWTPDVMVYNSAEANIVDHFAKTNKLVYSNGGVLWVPTFKVRTYCKMDLRFWPFDEQSCEIKMGSWTFSAYAINLLIETSNTVDFSHYQGTEWEIISGTAERHETIYPCCPEPYTDITFYLNFRRRSPMFKAIAIVPAMVIVFMVLSSFWLPPQAGEKLLLNGIACVMVCLLLLYLSKLLPIMDSTSPLIVTFYSHTLYLLCGSIVISIIVINLSRNPKSSPVSSSLKKNLLDGFLGKCLSKVIDDELKEKAPVVTVEENKTNDGHHVTQTPINTKNNLIQNEWIRLAVVIDRIAFIIYVILFIVMGFMHFI